MRNSVEESKTTHVDRVASNADRDISTLHDNTEQTKEACSVRGAGVLDRIAALDRASRASRAAGRGWIRTFKQRTLF